MTGSECKEIIRKRRRRRRVNPLLTSSSLSFNLMLIHVHGRNQPVRLRWNGNDEYHQADPNVFLISRQNISLISSTAANRWILCSPETSIDFDWSAKERECLVGMVGDLKKIEMAGKSLNRAVNRFPIFFYISLGKQEKGCWLNYSRRDIFIFPRRKRRRVHAASSFSGK